MILYSLLPPKLLSFYINLSAIYLQVLRIVIGARGGAGPAVYGGGGGGGPREW